MAAPPLPPVPKTPKGPEAPLTANPASVSSLLQNTMVIYGPTGSRKTSQIRAFAKYIYEKTGKKTRLISMDGGGWGTAQDYIDAGIIEPWRLVEEANPRVAILKASRGAWPESMDKGFRSSSKLIESLPEKRKEAMKEVGAYAVEGWASIASVTMRYDISKGRGGAEGTVARWEERLNEGDASETPEIFGAPSRSSYGITQSFLLDIIRNFSGLPLERVLYTSLEGKGVDKMDGVTNYGPATVGGAITALIPAFVGDCLHFEDFKEEEGVDPKNPKQKLIKEGVRAWFTKHPDAQTGVMWPAKSRIIPEQIGEFRKRLGPSGYFVLGDNAEPDLGTYLRLQDEMLGKGVDKALAWKKMIDEKREKGEL
jgi:hypothetical protein